MMWQTGNDGKGAQISMQTGWHRLAATALLVVTATTLEAAGSETPGGDVDPIPSIDEIFAPFTQPDVPGCAVGVSLGGVPVHLRGYGLANLAYGVPISADTPFHAASLAKPFTAMAVLLLVEDGAVGLDDDVRVYLPELPDYGHTIKIRHLLQHTSGLRDQWDLLVLNGWRHGHDLITDDDAVGVVLKQKALNFPPGTQHLYSNTGYTLLARIVARVSGETFREFTNRRIFEPLGMTSSFFRDNVREIVPGEAYGYALVEGGFETDLTHFATVGPTSLITTAADLLRWERNFIALQVLSPSTLELMTQPGSVDGTPIDYGLGLTIGTHRGERVIEHGGADAGFRVHFLRFPERELAVVCLCNLPAPAFSLARRVADAFLEAPETGWAPAPPDGAEAPTGAAPEPLGPRERLALTGLYRQAPGGQLFEIFAQPDAMYLRLTGSEWKLLPLAEDRLGLEDSPIEITVERDGAGAVAALSLSARGRFERVARARPVDRDWSALAGIYDSEELDIPYRIERRADGAAISWLKQRPVALRPATADVYFADRLVIRVTRNRRGRVSGFTLDTGRVRGIRFERR